MRSGSEAGSYLRLIDFVYHSTLGLRVIKKRRREEENLFASSAHTNGCVQGLGLRIGGLMFRV